jgi:hypothetical protein
MNGGQLKGQGCPLMSGSWTRDPEGNNMKRKVPSLSHDHSSSTHTYRHLPEMSSHEPETQEDSFRAESSWNRQMTLHDVTPEEHQPLMDRTASLVYDNIKRAKTELAYMHEQRLRPEPPTTSKFSRKSKLPCK